MCRPLTGSSLSGSKYLEKSGASRSDQSQIVPLNLRRFRNISLIFLSDESQTRVIQFHLKAQFRVGALSDASHRAMSDDGMILQVRGGRFSAQRQEAVPAPAPLRPMATALF